MKVYVLFCPHCRVKTITHPPEHKVWKNKAWEGKDKLVKCTSCGMHLDALKGRRLTLKGKKPVSRIDLLEVR